jgi:hypothetical protein
MIDVKDLIPTPSVAEAMLAYEKAASEEVVAVNAANEAKRVERAAQSQLLAATRGARGIPHTPASHP